jgi:hypothetical protein
VELTAPVRKPEKVSVKSPVSAEMLSTGGTFTSHIMAQAETQDPAATAVASNTIRRRMVRRL